MQKVLLVQYFYKPFSSNQSFRYESIIEKYKEKNIRVDVLTSKHHGLPSIEETRNGFIYRENSNFLIKDLKNKEEKQKELPTHEKLKIKIKRKIREIGYKFIWPDFAALWIFKAVKKGRELVNNEDYDLIISGSFPFSSHLVAYFIQHKNPNKKSKWIVDYIDPFSLIDFDENPSNNSKLYGRFNKWVEKKINNTADKIIILKEALPAFKDNFPELLEKTKVAPPMLGINTKDFEEAKPFDFKNNGINIVYIGSLYKSIRNPEPILRVFQELALLNPNFYVHFIGDLKDCKEIVERYKDVSEVNIQTYGKVSRNEAISYMKGSDILLNISNKSQVQLPGKVVEYVFSNKKIINYSLQAQSHDSNFFKEVGISAKVLDIVGVEFDIELLNNFITSKVVIKEVNMDKFLPENIGKIYFE